MMTGAAEEATKHLASGLDETCALLVRILDELQARFELGADRIVLGGFSQGSIVSLEVTLRDPRPFAGLLLMSTTMLDSRQLQHAAARRSGTRALVSHGRADPVLPYALAESLVQHLRTANWAVQWVPFAGGHGIPPQVLDTASKLLPQWLA
jgi:phospholipase/carboxylesterase